MELTPFCNEKSQESVYYYNKFVQVMKFLQ